MEINAKSLLPAVATHPGRILKLELQARNLTQRDLAKMMGVGASYINELIKGKRNMTEETAIKLEETLGIPYMNWMNLQNRYYYVLKHKDRGQRRDCFSDGAEITNLREVINYTSEDNIDTRLSFDISNRISNLMKEKGVTPVEFARELGQSPSEITKWLSGQHNFTIATLGALGAFFGQPIITVG